MLNFLFPEVYVAANLLISNYLIFLKDLVQLNQIARLILWLLSN